MLYSSLESSIRHFLIREFYFNDELYYLKNDELSRIYANFILTTNYNIKKRRINTNFTNFPLKKDIPRIGLADLRINANFILTTNYHELKRINANCLCLRFAGDLCDLVDVVVDLLLGVDDVDVDHVLGFRIEGLTDLEGFPDESDEFFR